MGDAPRRGTGFVGFERMGRPERLAWTGRPLPALVAQLAARVAAGESASAVLGALSLHKPQVREAYLRAAGLDPEQL